MDARARLTLVWRTRNTDIMTPTHYLTRIPCTRAEADAVALMDEPFPAIETAPALVAMETEGGWELHMWTISPPDADLLGAFSALTVSGGSPTVETVADADWVTLSQAGLEPVSIGRFHLHTAERSGEERPGQWPLRIDAGLAFGTGQHATTAGCVGAAQRLARRRNVGNMLDVGTGSGVLAFVAHRLFARARLTAVDLDPVAVIVAKNNARLNHVKVGRGRGALTLVTAPGVQHPLILRRAPYDLVFANILAGPLTALAPSLSAVIAKGGILILAGLLQPQARKLIATYGARGMRLVWYDRRAEWPVLIFQHMRPASRRTAARGARRETANRGWQIDTL